MEQQIPAYIMVPSEGETVLCWGFDADKRPLTGVMGARINGQWQLTDPNITLGTVISWRYPDSRMRNGFLSREP